MMDSTFSLRPGRGARWSGDREGVDAWSRTTGAGGRGGGGADMTGAGGGGGGGWMRDRIKGTPALSKTTISTLLMSAVGSAATRNDWASHALSRRLRISRALPQPSLLHWDSIQGTRLCSSTSGNSACCRLAINRKIAASSFGS